MKSRGVNMGLNFDNLRNNGKIILLVFLVASVFIGLSCVSAADVDGNSSSSESHSGIYIHNNITIDNRFIDNHAFDDGDCPNHTAVIKNSTFVPNVAEPGDAIYLKDSSDSGLILDENGNFQMSLRGASASTGYTWKISSETYGVDLIDTKYVSDYDRLPIEYRPIGGGMTTYFTFHVNDDFDGHFYVKLILVSPSGEIVKEVDSNMIN